MNSLLLPNICIHYRPLCHKILNPKSWVKFGAAAKKRSAHSKMLHECVIFLINCRYIHDHHKPSYFIFWSSHTHTELFGGVSEWERAPRTGYKFFHQSISASLARAVMAGSLEYNHIFYTYATFKRLFWKMPAWYFIHTHTVPAARGAVEKHTQGAHTQYTPVNNMCGDLSRASLFRRMFCVVVLYRKNKQLTLVWLLEIGSRRLRGQRIFNARATATGIKLRLAHHEFYGRDAFSLRCKCIGSK